MHRRLWKPAVWLIAMAASLQAVTHPHMIVKTSEYAALQERAQRWPWSAMKAKALADAKGLAYRSADDFVDKCRRVHDIAGACALAYILDPEGRALYVRAVESQLAAALNDIRAEKGTKNEHTYNVPPAHAVFMTYLMLDIMYDDLSAVLRQAMEADCDFIALNHAHSWLESEYSIKAMAELYRNGCSLKFVDFKNRYYDYILSMTTEDGIYSTGPGYGNSLLFMDDLMQKKIFMDICAYQGYTEFYRHPKLQHLYEWLFGYSVTPFNRTYTFGDTPPDKDLDHWSVAALRASRFSSLAGRLARYRLGPLTDQWIQGRLLHYLLCDSVVQAGQRPSSRVFRNGGAWLVQDTDSTSALAAALWNINTEESSHTHLDVNSLHIAAYNAHILRNSGYDGYGEPDEATWAWIAKTAESSNTVLWEGRNHATWKGGGISESLIGEEWEYVKSSSGSALALAQHFRHLIFLKPRSGCAHGYFVITDEVKPIFPWGNSGMVNVAWHPNSSSEPQRLQEVYRWPVQGCQYGGTNVGVDLLPVNPPDNSEIRTGYLASYETCNRFHGRYLYNAYGLSDGRANIATIIFPFDRKHASAMMTRFSVDGAGAASIDHGQGVVDYVVAPAGTGIVNTEQVALNGRTALWREINTRLDSYFINNGTMFLQNRTGAGFHAEKSVTLFMRQDNGQILSPGTSITFFAENLVTVRVDGKPVPAGATGEDWMQVQVDSGAHRVQLLRTTTRVLQTKVEHSVSLQVYPNPSNQTARIAFQLTEAGEVTVGIYNLQGRLLAEPVHGWLPAGKHESTWHAYAAASGRYLCRLHSPAGTLVRKFTVQK